MEWLKDGDYLVVGDSVIEHYSAGTSHIPSERDRVDLANLALVIDDTSNCTVLVDDQYRTMEIIPDTYRQERQLH